MAIATSTAILIGAAVTAGTTSYFGKAQMDAAKDARKAQEGLEGDRRRQLASEAAAREAAAARAATAGQRAGTRTSFTQGLGFGSGNTAQGAGAGTLFGN